MRLLLPASALLLAACGGPLEIAEPPPNPFADHELLVTESTCPGLGDRCDELLLLSLELPPVVVVPREDGQWLEDVELAPRSGAVAFTRWHRGVDGAVVASVEVIGSLRSGQRQVIAPGKEPEISPDGSLVALARLDDGGVELRDLQGNLVRLLVPGGRGARAPRWSPDGAEIAMITGDDGRLEHVPVQGGAAEPYAGIAGVEEVAWAPSGDRLLVATSGGVTLMDRDGLHRVPRARLAGTTFQWSPAADALAFLSDAVQGRARLLISEPAGQAPRAVTGRVVWGSFSWSPEGDWLAYSSGVSTWVVRRADGTRIAVHESSGAQRDPLWVP